MLHKLMRAWARLIRILTHTLVPRVSSWHAASAHSAHGLVLLYRRAVHRDATLVKLRRCVHRRLLRKLRLLRTLSILLHVVLLRERRWLRRPLPHV
jgi:hypothetical protein